MSTEDQEHQKKISQRVQEALASGGCLTPLNLAEGAKTMRDLVISNAHRLKKWERYANLFGQIETMARNEIVVHQEEIDNQERLPIDKPESVSSDLGKPPRRGRN